VIEKKAYSSSGRSNLVPALVERTPQHSRSRERVLALSRHGLWIVYLNASPVQYHSEVDGLGFSKSTCTLRTGQGRTSHCSWHLADFLSDLLLCVGPMTFELCTTPGTVVDIMLLSPRLHSSIASQCGAKSVWYFLWLRS
jgi:hypothetical protein